MITVPDQAEVAGHECPSRAPIFIIGGLHVLGWGVLLAVVAPAGIVLGDNTAVLTTLGIGLTAYALGARHAFDADHIAAIDNTTRRFMDRGRPTSTVGLWFSLGHSTIVLLLCGALVLGFHAVEDAIHRDNAAWLTAAGVWGPTVSGLFLLIIAGANMYALRQRRKSLRGTATVGGGIVWRLIGSFDRFVDRPWRMYIVGFGFGLGMDTATEVGLLALTGSASIGHAPWWAVLTLPIVFAAGMSLVDTTQGALMRHAYAYQSADADTQRGNADIYCTVMTVLSAVTAFVVAMVELSGIAATTFDWDGPAAWLGGITIDYLGVWLTGIVLTVWAVAFVVIRSSRR